MQPRTPAKPTIDDQVNSSWALDQAALRTYLQQQRDAKLAEVDSLERLLGVRTRTAQIRAWFKDHRQEVTLLTKDM